MEKMLSINKETNTEDQGKVTLTELANICGSRFIKLATRKKRIRVIITQNSIPYEDSTTGWLITKSNAEKVKSIYEKDWKDSEDPKDDPVAKENLSLKSDLKEKIRAYEALRKESDDLQEKVKDLTSKNDTLEKQLIKSNSDYQEANKQLAAAVQRSQELVHTQQRLSVVNMEMQKQISDLSTQVVDANQKLASSQNQVISQQEEMSKLKERNEKLMNRSFFARLFNKDVKEDD